MPKCKAYTVCEKFKLITHMKWRMVMQDAKVGGHSRIDILKMIERWSEAVRLYLQCARQHLLAVKEHMHSPRQHAGHRIHCTTEPCLFRL